ncbi:alpha/beta hydrolase [Aggregicoccus sp. 17bor-14]|uniref:alpha/beta fold hydrolase n=1 Tax=Myxococcaceae TaxID=31 RepID=UPI00129D21C2|nr:MULTISPECIES: alpha/beta hydrolase [Myxococcaceae]MBF5043374.1 alpha/beta hydrolase [Simulacricoccus sp. 17bor-14]MRI89132.1 alpha/beta hydrolase [Aggregicoccus sp. 17bor-14]
MDRRTRTFSSPDGTRLALTELGRGPPLLCHPGGPGRASVYLEDLAGLAEERTLLLLDPRGTGSSEMPADPSTLRFDRLADDLEAARAHLGLARMDVLAHSAGAVVAEVWAARHPDGVGALVLVTPSDRLQGGRHADVPAIRASRAGEPWYADAAAAERALASAPPEAQQPLVRRTRPFFYGRWDARIQAHAAGAEAQSSAAAEEGYGRDAGGVDTAGLAAQLARVRAPVLVVGGARDGITGVASVHAVARCFPSARALVLPEAGHFPWIDAPEAFREAVGRFLRDAVARA